MYHLGRFTIAATLLVTLVFLVDHGRCQPKENQVIGEGLPTLSWEVVHFVNSVLLLVENVITLFQSALNGGDITLQQVLAILPKVLSTPPEAILGLVASLGIDMVQVLQGTINIIFVSVGKFGVFVEALEAQAVGCYSQNADPVVTILLESLTACVSGPINSEVVNIDAIASDLQYLFEVLRIVVVEFYFGESLLDWFTVVFDLFVAEGAEIGKVVVNIAEIGVSVATVVPELGVCVSETFALTTPLELGTMALGFVTCTLAGV